MKPDAANNTALSGKVTPLIPITFFKSVLKVGGNYWSLLSTTASNKNSIGSERLKRNIATASLCDPAP